MSGLLPTYFTGPHCRHHRARLHHAPDEELRRLGRWRERANDVIAATADLGGVVRDRLLVELAAAVEEAGGEVPHEYRRTAPAHAHGPSFVGPPAADARDQSRR